MSACPTSPTPAGTSAHPAWATDQSRLPDARPVGRPDQDLIRTGVDHVVAIEQEQAAGILGRQLRRLGKPADVLDDDIVFVRIVGRETDVARYLVTAGDLAPDLEGRPDDFGQGDSCGAQIVIEP